MGRVSVIVAVDEKWGIARKGSIPWKNQEDMNWFKLFTMFKIVVISRTTWKSMGLRPLPGRYLLIVSTSPETLKIPPNVGLSVSVNELTALIEGRTSILELYTKKTGGITDPSIELSIYDTSNIIVAGGTRLYTEVLTHSFSYKKEAVSTLFITHIKGDYQCDSFFPQQLIPPKLVTSIKGVTTTMQIYSN